MIPLRDDIRTRTVPVVNYVLIALNVLAFVLELGMGSDLPRFFGDHSVVPVLYTGRDHSLSLVEVLVGTLEPDLAFRLVFSMFLHGGFAHILGNMLYLWIFGDNVEDALGHVRYLAFYLICGVAAGLAHAFMLPGSKLPLIGASGAIAGVIAAYLILHPRVMVWVLAFRIIPLKISALWVLGIWVVTQVFMVLLKQQDQVAWWAHIGGMAAGAILVLFMRRPGMPLFDRGITSAR